MRRVMVSPRDQFQRVEKDKEIERQLHKDLLEQLQQTFEKEIADRYKAKHPSRKVPTNPAAFIVADVELYEEVIEPYRKRAKELYENHNCRIKQIDETLKDLANWAIVRSLPRPSQWSPDGPWQIYSIHPISTFSTQTSPGSYALALAFMDAWNISYVAPEVECHVIMPPADMVEKHSGLKDCGDAAVCFVYVEEHVDVRLLHAMSPINLPKEANLYRETIKRLWAIGANPRVINPFLPHGFETEVGITYNGCDTSPRKLYCARCRQTLPPDIRRKLCDCGYHLISLDS